MLLFYLRDYPLFSFIFCSLCCSLKCLCSNLVFIKIDLHSKAQGLENCHFDFFWAVTYKKLRTEIFDVFVSLCIGARKFGKRVVISRTESKNTLKYVKKGFRGRNTNGEK